MLLEPLLGVPRQFEKLHALVHVGLVGVLVPFNLAQAAVLLVAPLVRHALEERRIDQPVELINIHGVNAVIEPLVLSLMALDRLFALAPFVGVAGVKRVVVADTKAQVTGFEIDSETGHDVRRELAAAVVGRGWGLLEMRPMRMSLEEIFLHVTTEDVATPPAAAEASYE